MKKVLNLYAGIGGNRKLWPNDLDITAVELNPEIAKIYSDFYPNDNVIVGNAHDYLIENYKEFDFIWASPPCPSHSRINFSQVRKLEYPDMKLYQEILFLESWFKGKYVVENVIPYYEPLIKPQMSGRHCFWANFKIPNLNCSTKVRNDPGETTEWKMQQRGIIVKDFHQYKGDKRQLLNNCVEPEIGLAILNRALDIQDASSINQQNLFSIAI
jgi:DNA (cytosine-5)-methyltransferase 1